jgi:hypothetical protein
MQFDKHAHDFTFLPTTEWRLAIDPKTITVHDKSAGAKMPFHAWAVGSQPVTMSATACQIEWGIEKGTAAPPPTSPNACVGPKFNVTLAPFGAAKLRLGEIPTMAV